MFHICRVVSLIILATVQASGAQGQDVDEPEARLAALKLILPKSDAPIANYVPAVRTGNLLFVAGHAECGEKFLSGKVGGATGRLANP